MGDTWIDATQSYENETGGSSTEITQASNDDLLSVPLSSDPSNLIRLVNNPATNTNNLYILQANTAGEIRFLTKDAYLNNDVSANEGNLYYNAKIGADGKLYLYWTYNVIANPIYFSGWKDIMNDVAESFRDINLLEAGVFILEGQLTSLTANVATLDGIVSGHTGTLATHTTQIGIIDLALADLTTIVVNMASMKSFTHQGWSGWKRRTNVKNAWSRMSDRYNFTPSSTSATGITNAGELFSLGGNTGAETATIAGLVSRTAAEGGGAVNTALGAGKKFLDGLGYAFLGAGIVGGITAVAYTYDKQGAQNDEIALPFLYDVRAGLYNDSLKSAGDPTKKTLLPYQIHKNGLTISAGTNNGFTTAGIYEYEGNASYPEMSINILITAGLVAQIASVVNSGVKVWTVGDTIIIPKASIGGTSGSLTITVNTIYTATQIVDLHIAEAQARIDARDKKMKRRSNVVNYDDIDTTTFTNTTATQAYTDYWDTQETLTYKILKSRLNLLPTGTSDIDIYTSTGQVGIGTAPATRLHIYHATNNILRLETSTTGTNSIEFRRGTANDVFTDYRLISDTGVFKLQFENNLLAYGASGTELFNTTSTLTSIFKNTSFSGNVGINVAPHATYKLDVAGDINISTGSLLRVNGVAYKPAEAVLADTATALASGTILGISQGGTGASSHTLGNVILGNGSGALTSATGLNYTSGTTTLTAPNVNLPTGGKYKINSTDLALTDLTGTLQVNKGGTGATTFTADGLLIGNTTSAITQNAGLFYTTATSRLTAPNMNVPTGGKYKINNVDLSYNDLTDKLTAGTNIAISAGNVISATGGGTAYTAGDGIAISVANAISLSGTTTNSFTISRLLASGSIDMFILQNNPTNSLRIRQNFISANDFSYNIIQKTNNVDYPAITFRNGQLGIGTLNNPSYPLEVVGDINFSGELRKNSSIYKPAGAVLADTATDLATGAILSVGKGGTGATTFTAGALMVGNTTSALQTYAGLTWTSGTNLLTTTNLSVGTNANITGNVGIGTLAGAGGIKLNILGDVNIVGKTTQLGGIELTPATIAVSLPADITSTPAYISYTYAFLPQLGVYKGAIFTYAGTGTGTSYAITIPVGGLFCDILMVGGGGAGGIDIGGGGGGGAVLTGTNMFIPEGAYTLFVGRGAISRSGEARGQSTTGFGATILGGGSAGDTTWNSATNANDGGSGGGAKSVPDEWSRRGGFYGSSTKGALLQSATLYNGFIGGFGVVQSGQVCSAGGAGATANGGNGNTATGTSINVGGTGVMVDILGTNPQHYWGGGGAGGCYQATPSAGGFGGGGAGQRNDGGGSLTYGAHGANTYGATPIGSSIVNGSPHSGGGGAGVGYQSLVFAGSGGSGVIIIKYRRPVQATRSVDYLKGGTPASFDYKEGMVNGDYKVQIAYNGVNYDKIAVKGLTADVIIGSPDAPLVVKNAGDVVIPVGNVGIGIDPSTAYKLNINGNLNINGQIFQNGFTVNAGFQQYRTFNFTYSGDTNFLLTTRARYCNIICFCSTNAGWIASNGANMAVGEFRGSLNFNGGISNGVNNYFFYWTMQGDTPRPFKAWFGNGNNTTFTFIEMWYN